VRMMSVAVLSAGLVVAGACASAGGAGDSVEFALEPGTTYAFSGSARGAHHHENRRVAFMVPVNGDLMILGELSASMPGSHGACGAGGDRLRVRRRGRSWTSRVMRSGSACLPRAAPRRVWYRCCWSRSTGRVHRVANRDTDRSAACVYVLGTGPFDAPCLERSGIGGRDGSLRPGGATVVLAACERVAG
jgi:hypothetical protein